MPLPDLIMFTKPFEKLSNEEIGKKVKELGFDGVDVAIRLGYAMNPDNVAKEMPRAVKLWADMGLKTGMATNATDFLDPKAPVAERVYAACAEAGVPVIRLGYWPWNGNYWKTVSEIREALEGFARLSEKYGRVSVVHTHCDTIYGSNCAGLMHLLQGMDPKYLGANIDPGHMCLDGEYYEMGIDMVKDYLRMVTLKSACYVLDSDTEPRWKVKWVKMKEGLVPPRRVMKAFHDVGYPGPFTFHSEYTLPDSEVLKATKEDLDYIRELAKEFWV